MKPKNIKKIMGVELQRRGSNHKYVQLDDLDLLFELLKVKCAEDVAKDLGVPANCIRYRVKRYFPKDWENQIVKKRKTDR